MPGFARPRRTVEFDAEDCGGGARIQEAAEDAGLDMQLAARGRALVVVTIVAKAGERRIGTSPQYRRADRSSDLVRLERAQQPTAAGIRGFHLERAVGLARVADYLVGDQRVEMRISDDDDFIVGRFEGGRGGELAGFLAQLEREGVQIRMG